MKKFLVLLTLLWCFAVNASVNVAVYATPYTVSYFGYAGTITAIANAFAQTQTALDNSVTAGVSAPHLSNINISYISTEYTTSTVSLLAITNDTTILEARDNNNNDLTVVITNSGMYCGNSGFRYGGAGLGANVYLDPTLGFAVVDAVCMVNGNHLGHEIGHMMGLRDDATHDANSFVFPANHGYWFPSGAGAGWHTIMANPNNTGVSTQILRYSNYLLTYGGFPTGDKNYWPLADAANVLVDVQYTVGDFSNMKLAPIRYGSMIVPIITEIVGP